MQFDNPPNLQGIRSGQERVEITSSCFVGSSGVEEHHFMLKPVQYGRFADQLDWLGEAMTKALLEQRRR